MRRLVLIVLLVGCDRGGDPPAVEAEPPSAAEPGPAGHAPQIDWTRAPPPTPAGGVQEPGHVGSHACKGCHEEIFASYARHSMARSGMRALSSLDQRWLARIFDAGARARIPHERSGFAYRPFRRGDRYFIEETATGSDGRPMVARVQELTHALSAGTYGLAFYFRQGKELYHVPIDYYAKLDRWGLDPFAMGANARFTRALGPFCISCHSDYPLRSASTDTVFYDPLPAGVGCERCHGPGARHAETLRPEDTINPARLSPARQLDVCTQCHLQSWSVARAGRHEFSFRPGEPLAGFRMNYLPDPPEPDRFELLSHSGRLVESACWRGSGGRLVCTSCHDPHQSSTEMPPAWWDDRCNACHAERPCTESSAARAARGNHCVACHMRAGSTSNVPILQVTDHWIQRRPPPIRPGARAVPRRLVSWAERLGERGAGDDLLAVEAVAHHEAGLHDEARRRALAAARTRPRVPKLYELLVRLDPGGRTRVLETVLELDPDHRGALIAYARALMEQGTPEAAATASRALDRMLALHPDDQVALEYKATLLCRAGRIDEARPLLERAVDAGPDGAMAHVALAVLARRDGRAAVEIQHLEAARRVEPVDGWIGARLADLYRAGGDVQRANEITGALDRVPGGPRRTAATGWLPDSWR